MRRTWIIMIIAILTPVMLIAADSSNKSTAAKTAKSATGKIEGTVTDAETGEKLIGASVLIVGTQYGAQTDLDGKYVIFQVIPGVYTLKVTAVGYQAAEVTSVSVAAGMTTKQTFKLQPADVELDQSIDISGTRDRQEVREVEKQSSGAALYYSAPSQKERAALPNPSLMVPEATSPHYPPAHGGNAIVNGQGYDAMFFKNYGVNPFVDTDEDNLSTFAIDADDASYIMTRSYLERGELPPADAVRVEEFVNHFDYGYEPPRRDAFRVYIDGAPSRFGQNSRLVRIGIKGKEVDPRDRKPANLVFVIDVSGSMAREDRLELVKQSLHYLVDQLGEGDRVGIVVYGTEGRVILEPTGAENRRTILRAIDRLHPEGATNADDGLRLGYNMANRAFQPNKINRIILCSDGVANVGVTGPDAILDEIKRYADKGITLTTVGFGMGNYNDVLMEQLGNKGNGFYAYVDDLAEARRVFIENLTGMLQVIARDVKIQVDWNPAIVRSYRLLGYENRDVADEDFRDNRVDGGEIGAGHEVTALYEVKLWSDTRGKGKAVPDYDSDNYDSRDRSFYDFDSDDADGYSRWDEANRNDQYDRREKPGRNKNRYEQYPYDDPYDRDHYIVEGACSGQLGTVFIRFKDPQHGRVTEINRAIDGRDLAPSFAAAAPDLKLAAAAAEFSEILRQSYWARGSHLANVKAVVKDVLRHTNSPEVTELMNLVTRAMHYEDQLAER